MKKQHNFRVSFVKQVLIGDAPIDVALLKEAVLSVYLVLAFVLEQGVGVRVRHEKAWNVV